MPARRAARAERRHYTHLALIAVVAIIYTFAVAQFVLWQPVALNVGFDTAATVDATNANEYGEVGVGHVSDDADDGARRAPDDRPARPPDQGAARPTHA